MSRQNASDSYSSVVYALVLIGILGYVQSWIVLSSGPMILNANDLAEWASLVPAQRGTSPPLLVPLLLRLQPVLLSSLLGVVATGKKRMRFPAVAIFILAAAQLPPFEFVYDINNLNYRQQFGMAAVSLIAGFALIPLTSRGISAILILAIAALGIISAALGLSGAITLYSQFQLDAAPGAGIWILSLAYGFFIAIALREIMTLRRSRR